MTPLRHLYLFSACLVTTLGAMLPATAAEPYIEIRPGEYAMTNEVTDQVSKQCFKADKISASTLRAQFSNEESNNCEITDSHKQGETLVITMSCKFDQEAAGTVHMEVTSNGDEIQTSSEIKMMIEGQERSMAMKGVGKRVGGC